MNGSPLLNTYQISNISTEYWFMSEIRRLFLTIIKIKMYKFDRINNNKIMFLEGDEHKKKSVNRAVL